ncbi:MAG: hypothetical protein BIFFINMI_02168 [Phycisphaerae bacterium]|nr:hypothetical protein [Phycisphaerae bacterium]
MSDCLPAPAAPDGDGEMLHSRPRACMEWWYYHGHLRAGGEAWGFCLAFFRTRTASRDVAWPVRVAARLAFGPQYVPAHFSLTDAARGEFRYAHRRMVRGSAGAADSCYRVWCGDWSAEAAADGLHRLTARMRGAGLDLRMAPRGPAVAHGRDGWVRKNDCEPGRHYSLTRLDAHGTLRLAGRSHEVTGSAWMDREFGGWRLFHRWDWMGIQLHGGPEVMVSLHRDPSGRAIASAFAALVEGGRSTQLAADRFELRPRRTWTSPASGVRYPIAWTLRIPSADCELAIDPVLDHQELDTRGSTMILYWEGQSRVSGRLGGRPVTGDAYVELLGYDDSHLRVTLADWLAGERRLHRDGPGRRVGPGDA